MTKNKDTTEQTGKKPFYKKWWFWAVIVLAAASAFSDAGQSQAAEPDPLPSPSQSEQIDDIKLESNSAKRFIAEVKYAIKDEITAEHESIIDVVLLGRDLLVYIDFSDVDPYPITLEILGESRTASITGAILKLEDYDDLWDTITVDFGEIGHITNGKDAIEVKESGRYFRTKNFEFDRHDFP